VQISLRTRRPLAVAAAALVAIAATTALGASALAHSAPHRAHAAACADYPGQAAAQRAADTRDPDGDGLYCESLPCPCAGPTTGPAPGPVPTTPAPSQRSCRRPTSIGSDVAIQYARGPSRTDTTPRPRVPLMK
jgi:hypothetical protein